MSELRIDPIQNYAVIVAPERNKRPKDSFNDHPDEKGACPFCPGNESKTPPESYRIKDNLNNWILRTFPNKYPAITQSSNDKLSGYQEVLVETVNHNQLLADYSESHLIQVLGAYKNRILTFKEKKSTKVIIVFKNHGSQAGATLKHPHSQIAVLDFVPQEIKNKLKNLSQYHKDNSQCYYCNLLKKESSILETESFKTILPMDGRFAYEFWVLPQKHSTYYEEISDNELKQLAQIILQTMQALNKKLNQPSYNLVFHNGIYNEDVSGYFHWHLQIIPRTYHLAGFEWATGLYINPVDPKNAAKELKKTISKRGKNEAI